MPVLTDCSVKADDFCAYNVSAEDAVVKGESCVRVVKAPEKIGEFDTNTYAALRGVELHNGIIEMRLMSRLLPDAPEYARGFAGMVFRAADDSSEFESFYVRPTNGRDCTDPVRRKHGCQYFSFPGYTFAYFREFGIAAYEAPVDIALDEWFTLRAEVRDDAATFYVNDYANPVLCVEGLKHGADVLGMLGVYVDDGTEAFVSHISVESLQ